jgi:small multidrug resistance pump
MQALQSAGRQVLPRMQLHTRKKRMNSYLALGIAIIAEVIATTALKSSESFSRLVPSIITVIGYGTALYFLTVTMKTIPTGITYAIWSGLGIVLISITSYFFHQQKIDAMGMLGMALIISGVVVLNLFSKSGAH